MEVLIKAFTNAFESNIYLGSYLRDEKVGSLLRCYIKFIATYFAGASMGEGKFHRAIDNMGWTMLNSFDIESYKKDAIRGVVIKVLRREIVVTYRLLD